MSGRIISIPADAAVLPDPPFHFRAAAQTAGSAIASLAWLTLRARATRLGLMPAVTDAPLAADEIVAKARQL